MNFIASQPASRQPQGGIGMSEIRRLFTAFKRHWRAALLPLLLLLPVAVGISVFVPGKFQSKALVLFRQEPDASPLSRDIGPRETSVKPDRVQSLRALLMSDAILEQIWNDWHPDGPPITPKERAIDIQDMRTGIQLEAVGGELIQFTITGSKPEGLGKRLDIVIKRLLDALQNGIARGMVDAPERVRVIDPPRDPLLATTSRFVFFVMAGLASIAASFSIVLLAAIRDDRIGDPDDIRARFGLPVIAVIPRLDALQGYTRSPRLRRNKLQKLLPE